MTTPELIAANTALIRRIDELLQPFQWLSFKNSRDARLEKTRLDRDRVRMGVAEKNPETK